MKIRKDDTVMVISGRDKGKKGKVRFAYPKDERLLVEGINFIKKHSKAKGAAKQAGIIDLEAPVRVSDVMLLCGKCNHPTRIGFRFFLVQGTIAQRRGTIGAHRTEIDDPPYPAIARGPQGPDEADKVHLDDLLGIGSVALFVGRNGRAVNHTVDGLLEGAAD